MYNRPKTADCDHTELIWKQWLLDPPPSNLKFFFNASSQHAKIEELRYDWMCNQRDQEMAISTYDIIEKAVSIDSSLKDGSEASKHDWVYFLYIDMT